MEGLERRATAEAMADYFEADERIEAAPDVAFPARHGGDVGLHGGVAVGLRDLRVAAREEDGDLLALARLGLTRTWPGLRAGLRLPGFHFSLCADLSHQRRLVRQYNDGPRWRNVTDAHT